MPLNKINALHRGWNLNNPLSLDLTVTETEVIQMRNIVS